jgi:tetratricopeptide (TPR) repeat protein
MSTLHRLILSCILAAMGFPAAAPAAPLNWRACSVPVLGADKHAIVVACTSILGLAEIADADRERTLITRGRALHMIGDIDGAIRDFDEAIKLAPKDPEPLLRRASTAYSKGDLQKAAFLANQALTLDARNADAFNTLAVVAKAKQDFRAAKANYDKAIQLKPDYLLARENRIQLLNEMGDGRQGLKELSDMLDLHTAALDTEVTTFRDKELSYRTLARLQYATQLEWMGRLPEALDAFDNFVKVEPGPFSYGWRGRYHLERSEFDLAIADLDKALSYDSNFWILHEFKGQVLSCQAKYEEAVSEFTRSIELHPEGAAYWSRALALRALHRMAEAQRDAQTTVTADCCFIQQRKLKMLVELGYFVPVSTKEEWIPALRDAVQACMLDEKCW